MTNKVYSEGGRRLSVGQPISAPNAPTNSLMRRPLSLGLLALARPAPGCLDSASWHKRDVPSKDCAWVHGHLPQRCGVVGSDGSTAFDACECACTFGTEPPAERNATTTAPTLVPTAAPSPQGLDGNATTNSTSKKSRYYGRRLFRLCDVKSVWADSCGVR